jgi:hypothetical protein
MRSSQLDRQGSIVLRGAVTAAGAIADAGSGGWNVRKTGTGTYAISFDKPLPRVPSVSLHTYASSGAVMPEMQAGITQTGFGVTCVNTTTAAAADQSFGFEVII